MLRRKRLIASMARLVVSRGRFAQLSIAAISVAISTPAAAQTARLGVNLSGLEAAEGGALGWTHVAPTAADIDLALKNGVTLFRIPVRTYRLMPTIGGPLSSKEVAALKSATDRVLAQPGTEVIIDFHDYGRTKGNTFGSEIWNAKEIASFHDRLLTALGLRNSDRAILGLQNEPHLAKNWWVAAQAVTTELRRRGVTNMLSVSGTGYSTASQFERLQAPKIRVFVDPLNRTVFEPHAYHDKGGAGRYSGCVKGSESRIIAAIKSAEKNGYKILIGETAWGADANCDPVREKVIAAIKASPAVYGVTFWTLGNFALFPRYPFGLSGPTKGKASILFDRILREWRK